LRGVKSATIVTHRLADYDALGCALVLKEVLSSLGVESEIVCPEGLKGSGKTPYCRDSPSRIPDVYILADVASLSQIPFEIAGRAFSIDHHARGDPLPGIRDERPSCSEIAIELARELNVRLSEDALRAALLGIYHDTAKLTRADSRTFSTLSYILGELKRPLGQFLERQEESPSKKYAKLKAVLRLKAYESNIGIICTTHVGAHESDAAKVLLSSGCDVVIIASKHDDELRIFLRSIKADASKLALKIGDLLGGSGGGHREASGVVVKTRVSKRDLDKILESIVRGLEPEAKPVQ